MKGDELRNQPVPISVSAVDTRVDVLVVLDARRGRDRRLRLRQSRHRQLDALGQDELKKENGVQCHHRRHYRRYRNEVRIACRAQERPVSLRLHAVRARPRGTSRVRDPDARCAQFEVIVVPLVVDCVDHIGTIALLDGLSTSTRSVSV